MISRIDPRQADIFSECLTQEVKARLSAKKELGIGAVSEDGHPQGILTISSTDGIEDQKGKNAVLEYFYVLPRYRRQGVFKEMLSYLKENMGRANGLIVQLILPEMEVEEGILHTLGFEQLDDGNDIISIPISAMEYSILTFPNNLKLQDDLIPLDELMNEQREVFLKSFENDLPKGLHPESIPGRLLLDHSFVYLTNSGTYGGFLLASELSDGTLYLGSMFVKPECRHMAVVLLSALYSKATETTGRRAYSRIMYATASAEAAALSAHMLEGVEDDIRVMHTHNYYMKF